MVGTLLDVLGDDLREGVRDLAPAAANLIQFLFSELAALTRVDPISTEVRRAIQVDHGKSPLSRTGRICSSIHGLGD